jgi:hypothetical protein
MNNTSGVTSYPQLTNFASTMRLSEANRLRKSCRASVVYVHYCRQSAILPCLSSFADARSWLDQAHSIVDDTGELWTCIYVGEVAISSKGRRAATRLYYEFGGGYLRQGPPIELLCSMIYREKQWSLYHTNTGVALSRLRVYLLPEDRRSTQPGWKKTFGLLGRSFPIQWRRPRSRLGRRKVIS